MADPDIKNSIRSFGYDEAHLTSIVERGREKARTSAVPIAAVHATALFAYTEEAPLYGTVNYTMRTPHTAANPTDTRLKDYSSYIKHTTNALSSLPPHVSEVHGSVYRGMKTLLPRDVYAVGKVITWQAFSSSTKKQTATLDFVNQLAGRRLQGSLFIIASTGAKDIRHFSAIPDEEEVLFPPNSQARTLNQSNLCQTFRNPLPSPTRPVALYRTSRRPAPRHHP